MTHLNYLKYYHCSERNSDSFLFLSLFFAITEDGGVPFGGRIKSNSTSSIVQIIFWFF